MSEPVDEMWVNDVETIKVMADSRRLEILRMLQEPTTVKAISTEIDISPSKLYYHINLLEKHNFIRIVDHNIESGIVEKIYQVTARQFKIVNPLVRSDLPDDAAEALFTSLLSETQRDFRQAYVTRNKDEQVPPRHPFLSKKEFRLTDAQLTALHTKFVALIEEVTALGEQNSGSGDPLYDLTLVFFKHDREDQHDT